MTDPAPDRKRLEATLRGWFANLLPAINQDDTESARYVIQTPYGGLRRRAGRHTPDTFPKPREGLSAMEPRAQRAFPRLTVVGEVFDGGPPSRRFSREAAMGSTA